MAELTVNQCLSLWNSTTISEFRNDFWFICFPTPQCDAADRVSIHSSVISQSFSPQGIPILCACPSTSPPSSHPTQWPLSRAFPQLLSQRGPRSLSGFDDGADWHLKQIKRHISRSTQTNGIANASSPVTVLIPKDLGACGVTRTVADS